MTGCRVSALWEKFWTRGLGLELNKCEWQNGPGLLRCVWQSQPENDQSLRRRHVLPAYCDQRHASCPWCIIAETRSSKRTSRRMSSCGIGFAGLTFRNGSGVQYGMPSPMWLSRLGSNTDKAVCISGMKMCHSLAQFTLLAAYWNTFLQSFSENFHVQLSSCS